MRVIVTGGTGLIGRPLAARLVSDGHEVILLSRRPEQVKGLPAGVQVTGWDSRTAAGWAPLADGAGAIINLAGENIGASRWTAERKHRIRQSRIDAGRAVVEAVQAAEHKPEVIIQASGVGYYGPHGDEILTEDAPPGHDFGARVAAEAWEPSTAPVEAMGVRRVVIRSAPVLSRDGGALPRMMLPFRFFVGGPVGGGRQPFSWIHLADEIGAICFLMSNQAAQGVYNVSAPELLTNREFARALGRAMGRPSWFPAPAFLVRLLFGEMATVVLEGQRAAPERLQQLGFRFQYPCAEAALRDLMQ
jgi:uncharacterized protein